MLGEKNIKGDMLKKITLIKTDWLQKRIWIDLESYYNLYANKKLICVC